MSYVALRELTSAPAAPASGYGHLYLGATGDLNVLRDDGITKSLGSNGTWTPVIAGASTAGAHTYTNQLGRYTLNGSVCMAQFRVTINAKDGAMAGGVIITGWPFVSLNLGNFTQAGTIAFWTSLGTSVIWLGIQIRPGTQIADIFKTTAAATGVSSMVAADIANSTDIRGSIVYRVEQP